MSSPKSEEDSEGLRFFLPSGLGLNDEKPDGDDIGAYSQPRLDTLDNPSTSYGVSHLGMGRISSHGKPAVVQAPIGTRRPGHIFEGISPDQNLTNSQLANIQRSNYSASSGRVLASDTRIRTQIDAPVPTQRGAGLRSQAPPFTPAERDYSNPQRIPSYGTLNRGSQANGRNRFPDSRFGRRTVSNQRDQEKPSPQKHDSKTESRVNKHVPSEAKRTKKHQGDDPKTKDSSRRSSLSANKPDASSNKKRIQKNPVVKLKSKKGALKQLNDDLEPGAKTPKHTKGINVNGVAPSNLANASPKEAAVLDPKKTEFSVLKTSKRGSKRADKAVKLLVSPAITVTSQTDVSSFKEFEDLEIDEDKSAESEYDVKGEPKNDDKFPIKNMSPKKRDKLQLEATEITESSSSDEDFRDSSDSDDASDDPSQSEESPANSIGVFEYILNPSEMANKTRNFIRGARVFSVNMVMGCISLLWMAILNLVIIHKKALYTPLQDHHLLFCFAFSYCFPHIGSYLMMYTPQWVTPCLWYAFLMQMFCAHGPYILVSIFRVVLPLLFLTEGLSHASFVMDLNGSERMVVAFLLSSFRSQEYQRPLFLVSFGVQVCLALHYGTNPFVQWFNLVLSFLAVHPVLPPRKIVQAVQMSDAEVHVAFDGPPKLFDRAGALGNLPGLGLGLGLGNQIKKKSSTVPNIYSSIRHINSQSSVGFVNSAATDQGNLRKRNVVKKDRNVIVSKSKRRWASA